MPVFIPRHEKLGEGFSRSEKALSMIHPGRRSDGVQTAASWISDLTDLRKMILLCSFCRGKFNPRKNRYRRLHIADVTGATDGYVSNGMCDSCRQQTAVCGGGTGFVAEETYNLICQDPVEARRKARLRARG